MSPATPDFMLTLCLPYALCATLAYIRAWCSTLLNTRTSGESSCDSARSSGILLCRIRQNSVEMASCSLNGNATWLQLPGMQLGLTHHGHAYQLCNCLQICNCSSLRRICSCPSMCLPVYSGLQGLRREQPAEQQALLQHAIVLVYHSSTSLRHKMPSCLYVSAHP